MFDIEWTEEAAEQFKELEKAVGASTSGSSKSQKKSSRQLGLFKQVRKTVALLIRNPKHPGLNCHRYSGLVTPYDGTKTVWEAYAQNNTPGAYRVFWCYGPGKNQITIIAITPHP